MLITILAFWIELGDRQKDREANAWFILTTKSSGNSGKVGALEYLKSKGQNLQGLNLSCAAMNGNWSERELTCERRTYLSGVDLRPSFFRGGANLNESDFSGAELQFAKFDYAQLTQSKFIGSLLIGVSFSNARFFETDFTWSSLNDADFSNSSLIAVNFHNATLSGANFMAAEFTNGNLHGADISGANFSNTNIKPTSLIGAWAWEDNPPLLERKYLGLILLCPTNLKQLYYNSSIFTAHFLADKGLPLGCKNNP